MLSTLRTYRLFSALVVMAMLLGAAIPVVQEVCAMAEAAHAPFGHPCCCGDGETSEGEGAEEPAAMHHQPAVHAPVRTSVEAPCHDVRDASMTATCCTIQEAADVHLATPPPPPESPKPALSDVGALPFAMPDLEAAGSAHLARTSADPPPTSVPPRLLYAVFLI